MNSEEILQRLNERNTRTFMRVLNIEYIEVGDDYLVEIEAEALLDE